MPTQPYDVLGDFHNEMPPEPSVLAWPEPPPLGGTEWDGLTRPCRNCPPQLFNQRMLLHLLCCQTGTEGFCSSLFSTCPASNSCSGLFAARLALAEARDKVLWLGERLEKWCQSSWRWGCCPSTWSGPRAGPGTGGTGTGVVARGQGTALAAAGH